MEQCGTVWSGLVWYGMVRKGMFLSPSYYISSMSVWQPPHMFRRLPPLRLQHSMAPLTLSRSAPRSPLFLPLPHWRGPPVPLGQATVQALLHSEYRSRSYTTPAELLEAWYEVKVLTVGNLAGTLRVWLCHKFGFNVWLRHKKQINPKQRTKSLSGLFEICFHLQVAVFSCYWTCRSCLPPSHSRLPGPFQRFL